MKYYHTRLLTADEFSQFPRDQLEPTAIPDLVEPELKLVLLTVPPYYETRSQYISKHADIVELGEYRFTVEIPGSKITLWPRHPGWLAWLEKERSMGSVLEAWHWSFRPVSIQLIQRWQDLRWKIIP